MSDYPNPNIHRGDGVSGRGILIAILVILAVIIGLAILGSTSATDGETGVVPATDSAPAVAEETPVPTNN